MVAVAESGFRQRPQRLTRHHQHVFPQNLLDPDALGRDLLVGRLVLPERKQRGVLVGRNGLGLVGESGRSVHGSNLGVLEPWRASKHRSVLSFFAAKGSERIAWKRPHSVSRQGRQAPAQESRACAP